MQHLILVILTLLSINASAGLEPMFGCSTRDDSGGDDEGYSVEVVRNAVGDVSAFLYLTDPGGRRKYKTLSLKSEPGRHGGKAWVGTGVYIEVFDYLPKARGGRIFSWLRLPNDFGGTFEGPTLCKGPGLRD